MCVWVVGWLAGFGLLNCSHSLYEDRNSYWFCSSFKACYLNQQIFICQLNWPGKSNNFCLIDLI